MVFTDEFLEALVREIDDKERIYKAVEEKRDKSLVDLICDFIEKKEE